MSTIKNILQFIDYKGFSVNEFSKKISVSNGYFAKQKSSEGAVSSNIIEKIVSEYPEINTEWLLTGKGSMLKKDVGIAAKAVQKNEGIPLIPVEAMAGFGAGGLTVMDYDIQSFYVVPDFKGVDFMIRVKGSSMYPKYNSGDIVACKKLSLNDIFFQWNKVYVLDTVQGPLIKRVRKGSKEGYINLISDNISYEPFELKIKGNVNAIAIVIGVIRQE